VLGEGCSIIIKRSGAVEVQAGGAIRNAGAMAVEAGGRLGIKSSAALAVEAGGILDVFAGANLPGPLPRLGVEVEAGGSLSIKSSGAMEVEAGGSLTNAGAVEVQAGGRLGIKSAAALAVEAGGILDVFAGADLPGPLPRLGVEVEAGGDFKIRSGGQMQVATTGGLRNAGALEVEAGGSLKSSGAVEVEASGSLRNSGAMEVDTGGSIDVFVGGKMEVATLGYLRAEAGVAVTDAGSIKIYGTFDPATVTVQGNGVLTVEPGGTFSADTLVVTDNGLVDVFGGLTAQTVVLEGNGQLKPESGSVIHVQNRVPPTETFQVNDGSAQRSMVDSITLTFSSQVDISPGAFQLTQRLSGRTVDVSGLLRVTTTLDSQGHTVATLTFVGGWIVGGSLADGRYTLTVHSNLVHDHQFGVAMAADATDTFFRLYGDVNGDGKVDNTDSAALQKAYRSRRGMANYAWYFDVNNDGVIDATDYSQFLRRYGTSLPA
jgi:hypothetical protein